MLKLRWVAQPGKRQILVNPSSLSFLANSDVSVLWLENPTFEDEDSSSDAWNFRTSFRLPDTLWCLVMNNVRNMPIDLFTARLISANPILPAIQMLVFNMQPHPHIWYGPSTLDLARFVHDIRQARPLTAIHVTCPVLGYEKLYDGFEFEWYDLLFGNAELCKSASPALVF